MGKKSIGNLFGPVFVQVRVGCPNISILYLTITFIVVQLHYALQIVCATFLSCLHRKMIVLSMTA